MQELLFFVSSAVLVVFVLELFVKPWLLLGQLKARLGLDASEQEVAALRLELAELKQRLAALEQDKPTA